MPASALLAAVLVAALAAGGVLKFADRTAVAVAAETFGLRGAAARGAWLPLALVELALAAGLLAGAVLAAWAAAVVLAAFAVAQAIALLAGRAGAPCGCFGARGRISVRSAARTALLAAAAAILAAGVAGAMAPLPAVAALAALAIVVVAVARARRPAGALEVDGEGPPLGARLELGGEPPRLALFVSDGCRLCRALAPRAERLGGAVYDERADAAAWTAADVPGAPFAVALASDGTVLAKGTVNTRGQLLSVLRAGSERAARPGHDARSAEASSRRGFLQAAGGAFAALTAGPTIGSLVAPGEAEAFHFCGHIYTTDGCPHPTGLPRIDRRGYPLRAKDGKPVDDLGRPVDRDGAPLDDSGAPLLDPDGRPMPPATRTRVCTAAGKRYRITVRTDGSWYRCCNGHVRKLVDCCTTSKRRINGDRALRGYCYSKRRVFCVMYLQTRVPC